jgi:hypothetical protein
MFLQFVLLIFKKIIYLFNDYVRFHSNFLHIMIDVLNDGASIIFNKLIQKMFDI